jgi:amidohydrolase family protein/WD40 repeat protein
MSQHSLRCFALISTLLWSALSFAQQPALVTPRIAVVDHGARDPRISPDGSTIAVSILGKIWLLPSAGGEARQISYGVSWDTHPAWSADGQFLAYAQHLPSGSDVIVENLATGTAAAIFHTPSEIGEIAFNGAATELFAVVQRNQLDAHIVRIPSSGGLGSEGGPTGSQMVPVTQAQGWHEWSFALAPDSRMLYLESGRYGGANLYKIDLDSHTSLRLTHTVATDSSVNLSADGKNLVFLETEDAVESVIVRPLAGGSDRRAFSGDYADRQIALARDGSWAVMRAGRKLYRLELGSGKVTPIPFTARITLARPSRGDLAITHARLADGNSATIEVRDGRIAAIKAADASPSPDLAVIDGEGKFVIPGLMDNHYHYWDPFDGARLVAQGITTIRDPGANLSNSLDFREAIALGIIPGPDIFTCGPLVDGIGSYHPMVAVEISTPEGARRMVRALEASGVDAIKVYFLLNPAPLRAAVEEARAQHLPTTGHIGVHAGWQEAMDDGINGLNHIRVWRDILPLDRQPQGENESLDPARNRIARMQSDWNEIDPGGEAAGKIIASMREHKVGFDPTLGIQRIPEETRKSLGLDDFETMHGSYERMAKFVARAQRSGVTILAGTDNASLFDELESYAKAGIPASAILQAASINGARWLGKDKDFGSIEVGRRADLVLLDGDPMKDTKNLRRVAIVIKDGRVVARNDVKSQNAGKPQ